MSIKTNACRETAGQTKEAGADNAAGATESSPLAGEGCDSNRCESLAATGSSELVKPTDFRRVAPEHLRPHPVNVEIYGDQPGADLIASVRENGVLQALLVTPDNIIISGHMRHAASLAVAAADVPVTTVHPVDENAALDMLLTANRQRVKTNEQIARETKYRMQVEREKARLRQVAAGAGQLPAKSPEATGDARAIVAKQMGMGIKKVDQYVAIAETLDQLDASGDTEARATVTQALGKSANKAYNKIIVMNERARHGIVRPGPAVESAAPTVDRADIIARIQDDLADGMETWSTESLLAFEKVLAAFKADWFAREGEEAA